MPRTLQLATHTAKRTDKKAGGGGGAEGNGVAALGNGPDTCCIIRGSMQPCNCCIIIFGLRFIMSCSQFAPLPFPSLPILPTMLLNRLCSSNSCTTSPGYRPLPADILITLQQDNKTPPVQDTTGQTTPPRQPSSIRSSIRSSSTACAKTQLRIGHARMHGAGGARVGVGRGGGGGGGGGGEPMPIFHLRIGRLRVSKPRIEGLVRVEFDVRHRIHHLGTAR